MEKIKVGAVSYLNTKPLLYGIKRSAALMERIELVEEYPSKIASMLVDGSIDIGLAPVAVVPKMYEWHIVGNYCIGAESDVASVCLFSDVPLEKVKRILLDYQSRTSVNLCKILLRDYWKIDPVIEEAGENYIAEIAGTTAGVVIGDRALRQRKISKYAYDLAGGWRALSGLPFVFAAWISNKKLPEEFTELFDAANGVGINNIDAVLEENDCREYDLKKYYTENISYRLTEEKKRGMAQFLELLSGL